MERADIIPPPTPIFVFFDLLGCLIILLNTIRQSLTMTKGLIPQQNSELLSLERQRQGSVSTSLPSLGNIDLTVSISIRGLLRVVIPEQPVRNLTIRHQNCSRTSDK